MARFKTTAGHFIEVIEKQSIKVKQNRHAEDEVGGLKFHEDKVTPVIEEIEVDATVDVKNRIWVNQVDIPFTPEEEIARDAEELMYEFLKKEPIKLNAEQEMDLMLEGGVEA